jgi:hypothetical protein
MPALESSRCIPGTPVLALALAGLALSACGGGGSTQASVSSAHGTTASAATSATASTAKTTAPSTTGASASSSPTPRPSASVLAVSRKCVHKGRVTTCACQVPAHTAGAVVAEAKCRRDLLDDSLHIHRHGG